MKHFITLFLLFAAFIPSNATCPDTTNASYAVLPTYQDVVIDSIVINGNKRTKDFIILRELLFKPGDTIKNSAEILSASKTNLLNTGLFLSVECMLHGTICSITVEERWYVFPKPYFEIIDRNFNVWWVEQEHAIARTNYGLDFIWYNFTGRNDALHIRTITGYSHKYDLTYNRPLIGKESNFGGGFSFSYLDSKQVAYNTQFDKLVFYTGNATVRKKINASAHLSRRSGFYATHDLQLQYHYLFVADTVALLNPLYFYEGKNALQFLSLTYKFIYSHVDDRAYPLSGTFAELQMGKPGLGIFDSINQLTFLAQYNYYLPISDALFLQGQAAASSVFGNFYPYGTAPGLGYCENFVRGYEYYVANGQHTFLLRTNVKYKIFDVHLNAPIINWNVFENIPLKAFAKLFADAGYVADNYFYENNSLANTLQYSIGAGIDITTYYDWVFRLETAVNAFGEIGVFLHTGLDLDTYEDCNLW